MRTGVLERSVSLRRQAIRYSRRAPGQLTILLVVVVLLCLASGIASVLDIQRRRDVLAGVADRSGPLTGAAMEIYQSLSDAHATAASSYLISGVEPAELRDRYSINITEAAAALSTASAGSPTGGNAIEACKPAAGTTARDSATIITELVAYLPAYTGIIETARMYKRQGYPEGVAYLQEASYLVQTKMLPSAQELFCAETIRLAKAQSRVGVVGWFLLALGFLAVGGLVAVQVYLARTTNRILNAGLLVATLAASAAVSWFVIATASAADRSEVSRQEGSAAFEAFAQARIKALEARSDEALMLVARGNGKAYEDHFNAAKADLNEGLFARAEAAATRPETAEKIQSAKSAWKGWQDSHLALRIQEAADYNEAVKMAVRQGALSSTVDGEFGRAIDHAKGQFAEETAKARGALKTADIGVATLMVLAVLGIAFGFAPRLREFR